MAGKATGKWLTLAFLALLIFAALTAHAGALTISSSDSVEVSTKSVSGWDKLSSGDLSTKTITKAEPVKLTITSEKEKVEPVVQKEKVEPVVQVNPGADLVVKANYAGGDIDYVQVGKDKIEGYSTYGKSSTYPWGIYWCIHDIGGKPMLVYAEFSGRKVWYAPVGQKTIDSLTATLEKGEMPDIAIIQAAVGA